MTYTVKVTREGSAWLADVNDVPGAQTYAGNLVALDAAVREVLALVLDVDDESSFEITYEYANLDLETARAVEIGKRRAALVQEQADLAAEAADRIVDMARKGLSVRDISRILRMSPGRVSQIAQEHTGGTLVRATRLASMKASAGRVKVTRKAADEAHARNVAGDVHAH